LKKGNKMESFLYNIGNYFISKIEENNILYEVPKTNEEVFPLFVGWYFIENFYPRIL
jgi:hypothetical protein